VKRLVAVLAFYCGWKKLFYFCFISVLRADIFSVFFCFSVLFQVCNGCRARKNAKQSRRRSVVVCLVK